jgi:hypothetical protein
VRANEDIDGINLDDAEVADKDKERAARRWCRRATAKALRAERNAARLGAVN